MKSKHPDKFQRWMIASFFLIPLVLLGGTVAVSKMKIVGEADLDREVTGHSHTNTY